MDPNRQRVLFAALRYAEIADRAEANEADAIAEAGAEAAAPPKPAEAATNAPPPSMQPIDKQGAFSKVEKTVTAQLPPQFG